MRPQPDFVRAVMAELGLSQTDLGVALKKPNAYATVHGWISGRLKLGYDDTMKMLELCGWLNMGEDARRAAGLPPDPLEQIATGVRELLDNQKEFLDAVAEQRATPKRPGRARPKR